MVTIDKDVDIQEWDLRVMDYDSGWIRLGFIYFTLVDISGRKLLRYRLQSW